MQGYHELTTVKGKPCINPNEETEAKRPKSLFQYHNATAKRKNRRPRPVFLTTVLESDFHLQIGFLIPFPKIKVNLALVSQT